MKDEKAQTVRQDRSKIRAITCQSLSQPLSNTWFSLNAQPVQTAEIQNKTLQEF